MRWGDGRPGLERYRADDLGVNALRLGWKTPTPAPSTSLWSEVGDGIDYYFVHGPDLDRVVAGYRRVTGEAPMMPSWAFGLWQSRERYATQQESLDVVAGYRSRGIPLDVIVQDWQYWTIDAWGSHQFDPTRFPDPDAWITTLRDTHHTRMMISVWPKFYAGTANFTLYEDDGLTYGYERGEFSRIPLTWVDATRTLTLGQRDGAFPGMLAERSFRVVIVSANTPVRFSFTPTPERTLTYSGELVQATF